MQYKLYDYAMADKDGRPIHPDRQYQLFEKSRGSDAYGEYADYRGNKDAVLMYLMRFRSDFTGLIGKHATEREVTAYDEQQDTIKTRRVGDDDYPYAAFVCMPRLGKIACVDSGRIKADTAMSRLHVILLSRQKVFFTFEVLREPYDLRKAVKRFNVTEVMFEILPVNPHTGDLGKRLDEARKRDHIKKLQGRAQASASDPLKLDGGFLSAVQELQETGHSKVGFTGKTLDGRAEVKVPKPSKARSLAQDPEKVVPGEAVAVKIIFAGLRLDYPFKQGHVTEIRTITRLLMPKDREEHS